MFIYPKLTCLGAVRLNNLPVTFKAHNLWIVEVAILATRNESRLPFVMCARSSEQWSCISYLKSAFIKQFVWRRTWHNKWIVDGVWGGGECERESYETPFSNAAESTHVIQIRVVSLPLRRLVHLFSCIQQIEYIRYSPRSLSFCETGINFLPADRTVYNIFIFLRMEEQSIYHYPLSVNYIPLDQYWKIKGMIMTNELENICLSLDS